MGLLHLRARGHKPLALVSSAFPSRLTQIGGATGMIGDPSGRSTERNALSEADLATNVAGITAQVHAFFERGTAYAAARGYSPGEVEVTVVNNYDWFRGVGFLAFLRDVGKFARVNTMLARESVKNRLDSDAGISFTEFSYQLLQAHDFATLYREQGCRLQLGGSDQWGNIVAGIDLIHRVRGQAAAEAAQKAEEERRAAEAGMTGSERREAARQAKVSAAAARRAEREAAKAGAGAAAEAVEAARSEAPPAFGLTIPLLTTASGEKFGKSAGNAVWLDPARTSVSDFYQFFYRAPDADVRKYLSLLTLVPRERIDEVMAAHERAPRERAAQQLLADEVTELVHGPEGVRRAHAAKDILYAKDPRGLRAADVLDALEGDPRLIRVRRSEIEGVPVSKLVAMHGLVGSRSEATRLIKPKNTAIHINEIPVTDPRQEVHQSNLVDKHLAIVRRGTRDMLVFYITYDE
jgi:tyrosyl-tRNA synthetase